MMRRMLVAGNWKMHGVGGDLAQITAVSIAAETSAADVALCVPATLIDRAVRASPGFSIGGQDVHEAETGAHTGCISAAMLVDAGATMVIVGHSERREAQGETDAQVKSKAETALRAGLRVILCVGESDAVREAGRAVETVIAQLSASLPTSIGDGAAICVAYEPIWAIGTGKIPSLDDIAEMHAAIRQRLLDVYGDSGLAVRLLYGGSVKAANAAEIFAVAHVDGALVGGASLKAKDFLPIVDAASARSAR